MEKVVCSYHCKAAQEMVLGHFSVVNKSLKLGSKERSLSSSSGCSRWKSVTATVVCWLKRWMQKI